MTTRCHRHTDFDASAEQARWVSNRFGRTIAHHLTGRPPILGRPTIAAYKNPYAARFLRGERITMDDIRPQWMRAARRAAWEVHRAAMVQAMFAMGMPHAAGACADVEYNDFMISGRMDGHVV